MRGHRAGIMGMHGSNPRLAERGLGRGAISAWTGDESIMPQTSALLESNHRMPRLSREPGEETAPQELSLCWGGGETGTWVSVLGPQLDGTLAPPLPSARPKASVGGLWSPALRPSQTPALHVHSLPSV